MSSLEPLYGMPTGIEVKLTAKKYFTLENAISLPSDINGTCKFENLTIRASLHETAYILISVEGLVKLWSIFYNPGNIQQTPWGIYPIFTTSPLMSI